MGRMLDRSLNSRGLEGPWVRFVISDNAGGLAFPTLEAVEAGGVFDQDFLAVLRIGGPDE